MYVFPHIGGRQLHHLDRQAVKDFYKTLLKEAAPTGSRRRRYRRGERSPAAVVEGRSRQSRMHVRAVERGT
jgi:hypothetical protein